MITGESSARRVSLERLEDELKSQRELAMRRGAVDRDWCQKTIRWVADWVPEAEISLIAALGQIARN